MKCSDFVSLGATETGLLECFAGGGMATIAIRIPVNFKEAAAEEAVLRRISFSAFSRMCMIDELTKGNK